MASTPPSPKKWFGRGLPYVKLDDLKGRLIVIEGTDGVGRSTQVAMLREWLQVNGYAVVETGWTRSKLLGPAIFEAKQRHALNPLTFSMIYASDFADRLEGEIIPALRAGSVVLSDRYIYTAFARDTVRGLSPEWVRTLYGFALVPDMVFHISTTLSNLVPRVLRARRLNYWEAGVDMGLGSDLYDSFVKYQKRMIQAYAKMGEEFGFLDLDGQLPPDQIQKSIRAEIEKRLFRRRKKNDALPAAPGAADEQAAVPAPEGGQESR